MNRHIISLLRATALQVRRSSIVISSRRLCTAHTIQSSRVGSPLATNGNTVNPGATRKFSTASQAQSYSTEYMSVLRNPSQDKVEVFIYRLLESNNLSAATTLLHTFFSEEYRSGYFALADGDAREDSQPIFNLILSNQLWSLYASKVCESAHYPGASLIYHSLIEPSEPISDHLQSNLHPFLLSTEMLEYLSMIFVSNADSYKVKGLLAYFKRFYSFIGHRDTFKALMLSLVESYSRAGDLKSSLDMFDRAYYIFAKNTGYVSHKASRTNVFTNYRLRRLATRQNLYGYDIHSSKSKLMLDVGEELIANEKVHGDLRLFRPSQEHNIYTLPERPYYSVIDDAVLVSDLPNFYDLINKNVMTLMEDENDAMGSSEKLATLMNFIDSSRPLLQLFIFKSLCDSGHIHQAYSILIELNKTHPRRSNVEIDNYLVFYQACHHRITTGLVEDDRERLLLHQMCVGLMNMQDIKTLRWKVGNRYLEVLQWFITSMISVSPRSQFSSLEAILTPFLDEVKPKLDRGVISLDRAIYDEYATIVHQGYDFVVPTKA